MTVWVAVGQAVGVAVAAAVGGGPSVAVDVAVGEGSGVTVCVTVADGVTFGDAVGVGVATTHLGAQKTLVLSCRPSSSSASTLEWAKGPSAGNGPWVKAKVSTVPPAVRLLLLTGTLQSIPFSEGLLVGCLMVMVVTNTSWPVPVGGHAQNRNLGTPEF